MILFQNTRSKKDIRLNQSKTDQPIFIENTNQSANLNSCFFSNRSLYQDLGELIECALENQR